MRAVAKPFAPDDPLALVGVALPPSEGALEEMARTFIQEYLLQGWDERRLLALFRNPFYRAPHLVYRARGEEYVRRLIAEALAGWGQTCALQEESHHA
ncbi:MAG: hypothetical protein QN152_09965 [Armatimonadota bacterium]|nr:hypothetical protein [Armatimonadota bacterium]MDR7464931.1 hypothetical protein [Armatimonadota bacterium]MDR7468513.1 hypothetical protein [Armatimonadota bacterium]MDR7474513.1 hypothetical protein [Armatimonadota bacterium]MDR7539836.1 hypothetical protein [Armatimonadota bacterium]